MYTEIHSYVFSDNLIISVLASCSPIGCLTQRLWNCWRTHRNKGLLERNDCIQQIRFAVRGYEYSVLIYIIVGCTINSQIIRVSFTLLSLIQFYISYPVLYYSFTINCYQFREHHEK